jgi:hypothetical protein
MSAAAGALVELVLGLIRAHRLEQWGKLCFAMSWSYATAFNFAAGTALMSGRAGSTALGAGMIAGASAVLYLFARSPLTRGLMVAAPRDLIVGAERDAGLVIIDRK